MQHVIKKQTIQITLPKQADAFAVQHAFSKHYRSDILPLLEQVFDELSVDEETLHIEQLEIDLGEFSESELLRSNWTSAILSKIRDQLYEKISKRTEGQMYARELKSLGICRQWLSYMQQGWLPWNTVQINKAWHNQVLEALAVDFASVTELKKMIRERPAVSSRIVYQHNELFLISLMEILTAENQRNLSNAVNELLEIFSIAFPVDFPSSRTKEVRTEIWEQLLWLSVTENKMNFHKLIEKVLIAVLPNAMVITSIIRQRSSTFPVTLPVLKKLEEKPELFSEKKPFNYDEPHKTDSNPEFDIKNSITDDGIFVSFAGQVLVHPFLHSLFKRLNLVKEGKFENTNKQQKALYLLHYLASGSSSAEEFELTVPKLLCNWPLNMPVKKDLELTEDDISEAEQMLSVVIEQWTVLKNTSVDGLREGFLCRNGKIINRNGQLHLQVEAKSIDLLLDQLPWNLSMIKLPWMKELLRVEWR